MLLSHEAWPWTPSTAHTTLSLGNPITGDLVTSHLRDSQVFFLISYWASGQHIQSPHNYLLMVISKTAPQIQNKLVTVLLKPDAPPVFPVSGNSFWELTVTPFFLMPLYPIHHWILQISFLYTSKVSISHHLPWHYFSPGMLKNSLWPVLSYILWPPSNQSILQPERLFCKYLKLIMSFNGFQ